MTALGAKDTSGGPEMNKGLVFRKLIGKSKYCTNKCKITIAIGFRKEGCLFLGEALLKAMI